MGLSVSDARTITLAGTATHYHARRHCHAISRSPALPRTITLAGTATLAGAAVHGTLRTTTHNDASLNGYSALTVICVITGTAITIAS
jgi:hypothetical protein